MSYRESDLETMIRHLCILACDLAAEHEGLDGHDLFTLIRAECEGAKSQESWANALACLTADDLADRLREREEP
jgi:hypothetical protein